VRIEHRAQGFAAAPPPPAYGGPPPALLEEAATTSVAIPHPHSPPSTAGCGLRLAERFQRRLLYLRRASNRAGGVAIEPLWPNRILDQPYDRPRTFRDGHRETTAAPARPPWPQTVPTSATTLQRTPACVSAFGDNIA